MITLDQIEAKLLPHLPHDGRILRTPWTLMVRLRSRYDLGRFGAVGDELPAPEVGKDGRELVWRAPLRLVD